MPRVEWSADSAFALQNQLMQEQQPTVLTGALKAWPLLRWTWKDLRKLGDLVVPMELSWHGSDYRDLFR